jgi:3',5'-cyclic AMP phosphodiesterase CpdA
MTKLIAIGDLHGRDVWKQIDPDQYDHIIFLGDYTDSFVMSDASILRNLLAIIDFQERHPDKVTLLLGNHDIQYAYFPANRCSGFRLAMQPDLTDLFRTYRKQFCVASQTDNYLFTHAGLTNRWWVWAQRQSKRLSGWADLPLAMQLNRLLASAERDLLFSVGRARGGVQLGGPLWADQRETLADPLSGWHQVVGHTPQESGIYTVDFGGGTALTYADVTDKHGATFYEITL